MKRKKKRKLSRVKCDLELKMIFLYFIVIKGLSLEKFMHLIKNPTLTV